jgi:hypothetical protein
MRNEWSLFFCKKNSNYKNMFIRTINLIEAIYLGLFRKFRRLLKLLPLPDQFWFLFPL